MNDILRAHVRKVFARCDSNPELSLVEEMRRAFPEKDRLDEVLNIIERSAEGAATRMKVNLDLSARFQGPEEVAQAMGAYHEQIVVPIFLALQLEIVRLHVLAALAQDLE